MARYNFNDPLGGRIPSCVYYADTGYMYYTQGRAHIRQDPNLMLDMWDGHSGDYDITTMDEVLPGVFVNWQRPPIPIDRFTPVAPYVGAFGQDILDPFFGPALEHTFSVDHPRPGYYATNTGPTRGQSYYQAPRRANSYQAPAGPGQYPDPFAASRTPNAGPVRGQSYSQAPQRTNSYQAPARASGGATQALLHPFRSMEEPTRSGQTPRPSTNVPARAGSSFQAPGRTGSSLGPPRTASQLAPSRAGSFLGPPNAQRAPSYQNRGVSFLQRPQPTAATGAGRTPSLLTVPGQGGNIKPGSRSNSYGGARSFSIQGPLRNGSSFNINQGRANSFQAPVQGLRAPDDHMPSYRPFIHALHNQYRHLLVREQGQHFDHVDDSVLATYATARGFNWATENLETLAIKPQGLKSEAKSEVEVTSWSVPIPFLGLRHNVLEIFFPVEHESIANLSNDILRVLHIRLSNIENVPAWVSDFDLAESRRVVAAELGRRGFHERPHKVQFRGLDRVDSAAATPASDVDATGNSGKVAPVRPSASVFQPAQPAQDSRVRGLERELLHDAMTIRYTINPGTAHHSRRETSPMQKGKARATDDSLFETGEDSDDTLAPARDRANPSFSVSAPEEDLYSVSDKESSDHEESNNEVNHKESEDDDDEHKPSASNESPK